MIKRSFRKKITRVVVAVAALSLTIMSVFMFIMLYGLRGFFIESNIDSGKQAEEMSARTVTNQIHERMIRTTQGQANRADSILENFMNSVKVVADYVTDLYTHPEDYPDRTVSLPDKKNDGKLSVQLLHSASTDLDDPEVRDELGLVANVQDLLLAINRNDDDMSSNYIATKSGLMIQADYISSRKFDDDGNILPIEAKERPWYQGAEETRKPYFTSLKKDLHTGRLAVMCGVPFNKKGQFMGVAGAGMYIDELGKVVNAADIGKAGYSTLVDSDGKIILSTEGGELYSMDPDEAYDVRETDGEKYFSDAMRRAVDGKAGVELITMQGENYYMAYAPLKTVGWSLVTTVPSKEVNEPTTQLVSALAVSTKKSVEASGAQITFVFILVFVIVILLLFAAAQLARRSSRRLARPVKELTGKVRRVKGDDLDFSWDEDTGDEIQVLAESFGSLTDRMKQYIRDITEITKEKERIGAELNVATRIQASMLPTDFDKYDDLKRFTLFASMNPAKEVGGDFYDFFMVDDRKIALVMADVSGKGVPAALFMVRATTAIRTRTQSGGSPSEILSDVNDQLCIGNTEELFVTVWLAIIDVYTGEGMIANAGHEHPALRHKDGKYELVKYHHGPAVATMEGIPFREHEVKFEPGDTVFVYTDGVTEATNLNNELFGDDRVVAALNHDPDADPKDLLPTVRRDIDEFVGEASQFDDITMLAFRLD